MQHNTPFPAARVGWMAGSLTFLGILVLVVLGPSLVAGPPVSGTMDEAAIRAYFAHPVLAWFAVAAFPLAVGLLVFASCLREVLGATPRGRFLAGLGLVAVGVEVPLLLTQGAIVAALVGVVGAGGDVVPLFRFWDLLYNSAADQVEVVWVAAFALATRGVPGFPRWMPAYGLAAAALLQVVVFGLLLGWSSTVHLLLYLPTIVWFPLMFRGLWRNAHARVSLTRAPAAAGAL